MSGCAISIELYSPSYYKVLLFHCFQGMSTDITNHGHQMDTICSLANCFKEYMKFGDKVFNAISLLSLTMLVLSLLSCQLG